MNLRHSTVLFIALIATVTGCNNEQAKSIISPSNPQTETAKAEYGTLDIKVTFNNASQATAAKPAAIEAIDRVTAYVYDEDNGSSFSQDLTIADGKYSGRLQVRAQVELRVDLVFFDGETVKYMGRRSELYLSPNTVLPISIEESYMGVTVVSTTKVNCDMTYKVMLQENQFALYYEIDESSAADFSNPVTIYSDTDPGVELSKSEAGLFYYRARAMTEYGYGPYKYSPNPTEVVLVEGNIDVIGDMPLSDPRLTTAFLDFENRNASDWSIIKDSRYTGSAYVSSGALDGTGMYCYHLNLPYNVTTGIPKEIRSYYKPSENWSNYSLSFDIKLGVSTSVGVLFYMEPPADGTTPGAEEYTAFCLAVGTVKLNLWNVIDGEYTALGEGGEITSNTVYHIDINVGNNRIIVLQDGEEVINASTYFSGSRNEGAIGFYSNNYYQRILSVDIDNIMVSNIFTFIDPGDIIIPDILK